MELAGAHITQWIMSVATLVGLVGLIYVYNSLKTQIGSFKADHERSRRQNAVDLVRTWTIELDRNSSSAQKFVETLNKKQCLSIFEGNSFTLSDADDIEALKKCFDGAKIPEELVKAKTKYVVPGHVSYHIRWLIVQYLNLLETILLSARHSIASEDILKEQFTYLYDPERKSTTLSTFRQAINADKYYPSVTQFIQNLQVEKDAITEGKKPLT